MARRIRIIKKFNLIIYYYIIYYYNNMFKTPIITNGIWVNLNGVRRFIPLPVLKNMEIMDKKNPDEISDKLKKYINEVVNKMVIEIKSTKDKGKDGVDGKSAYEIAVERGYKGSEEEWLKSLKGEPGNNGSSVTPEQINDAVRLFMTQNKDLFKGDRGNNGSSVTPEQISNAVEQFMTQNKDLFKGEPGNDGDDGSSVTPQQIDIAVRKFIMDNTKVFINEIKNDTEFKEKICNECAKNFKAESDGSIEKLRTEIFDHLQKNNYIDAEFFRNFMLNLDSRFEKMGYKKSNRSWINRQIGKLTGNRPKPELPKGFETNSP